MYVHDIYSLIHEKLDTSRAIFKMQTLTFVAMKFLSLNKCSKTRANEIKIFVVTYAQLRRLASLD